MRPLNRIRRLQRLWKRLSLTELSSVGYLQADGLVLGLVCKFIIVVGCKSVNPFVCFFLTLRALFDDRS
jgi:hypothetical protein